MCKIVYGGSHLTEIRFFILDESNEKIVTDMLKLQKIVLKKYYFIYIYTPHCYFLSEKSRYGWR